METPFSKFHPAVIFVFFLSVLTFTMCLLHPLLSLIAFVTSSVYCLLLRRKKAVRELAVLLPLLVLISFVNLLFSTEGATILFSLGGRSFTLEALLYGLVAGTAFSAALQWLRCFGIVCTQDKLLAIFSVSLPSLTLLVSMVLRLVPALSARTEQIKENRRHIGKGMAESFSEKISVSVANIGTLIGWSLESSADTANSMNARGYGCEKRTSFAATPFHERDAFLLTAILSFDSLVVLGSLYGAAKVQYYPVLYFCFENRLYFVMYFGLFLLPSIIHISETIKWHISKSKI